MTPVQSFLPIRTAGRVDPHNHAPGSVFRSSVQRTQCSITHADRSVTHTDGGDNEDEMMTIGGVTRSTRLTATTLHTKHTKLSKGKGTKSERGERERGGKGRRGDMQLTDDTIDLLDESAMKRALGEFCGVTLRARWVVLRARWVTLRARWVV
jgi:hypothetical protein